MRGYTALAPLLILLPFSLNAAVITDGRMGAAQSLKGPEYSIDTTLGQQVGENLFHSFSQFSLSTTESALFKSTSDISRIISQVTGGEQSLIDGLISAEQGADLYLLNPAGIIFGNNVSLSLGGSFYASTATELKFADGSLLKQNTESSQLSSAAPSVFGFSDSAADLTLDGSFLELGTGKKLFLAGGNVNLNINTFAPELVARGGHVKIVASAVGDEVSADMLALESNLKGANLNLTEATILTDGTNPINAGGAVNLQAKNIDIKESIIRSRSVRNDDGNPMQLQAENITIDTGSQLSTSTLFFGGNAGDIVINADETIHVKGLSSAGAATSIRSNVGTTFANSASGQGGDIRLKAKNILFEDGASIGSNTYALGDGGHIDMQASNNITFAGVDSNDFGSGAYSVSAGKGNAGQINIKAPRVNLKDGAIVTAENVSLGQGGLVQIESDELNITGLTESGYGSFISASTQSLSSSAGQGGQVVVKTKALNIEDGGQITTSSLGAGTAGNLVINADKINAMGSDLQGQSSGIYAVAQDTGAAGQIEVNAGSIALSDEGQINSATFAGGQGGQININSGRLRLDNNALVTAVSASGSGVAGDIQLNMSGPILVGSGSAIETKANGADGGSITVDSSNYVYLRDSSLTTSVLDAAGNSGNGGNIHLNPRFVVQDGSPIIARAQRGNGGDILINTTGVYVFGSVLSSPIDASSEFGVDGVVTIRSPATNIVDSLLTMPTAFSQEKIVLDNSCAVAENLSSFVNKPRLGVPNQNNDWLGDRVILPLENQ